MDRRQFVFGGAAGVAFLAGCTDAELQHAQRVADGASDQDSEGFVYKHTFEEAGKYEYLSQSQADAGMVGRVDVVDEE